MLKKDSVVIGVLLGVCVPILTYALFLYLDEWIEYMDFRPMGNEPFTGFDNVYVPFSIVANLIPFHYFNNRRMFNSMRGVVLPTIIMVIAWGFYYGKFIF